MVKRSRMPPEGRPWPKSRSLIELTDQALQLECPGRVLVVRKRRFHAAWGSLGEQEIKEEGLRRRRLSRRRGGGRRRARAGRRRHRTVIFLAQRRSRCRGRRRGDAGARRWVERALAPACGEPERCRHGGHQSQPAPSVGGLSHVHPQLSPKPRKSWLPS